MWSHFINKRILGVLGYYKEGTYIYIGIYDYRVENVCFSAQFTYLFIGI